MNKKIAIVENGIHMTFLIAGETVRLINFSDTDKFEEGMNEVLQQNGYLAEYQEMTEEELQELLNIKKTRAYLLARQMSENGLIDIIGRGAGKKYKLK